jgi:FkbM family methyltransferase
MATLSERAFRAYVSAGDHPAKLRIVRRLWNWFVPSDGVLCDVGENLVMWLHPEDSIEGDLYCGRPHEPETSRFLDANLRDGMCAMFVGANSGVHLLRAAKRVGDTGKVVGVEPQPICLYRAQRNIESNGLRNVVLVAGALGDTNTVVPIGAAPEHHLGWSSIVLRESGVCPFHVAVWRYETILEQLRVPSVDFLLIDVEGYELPVLRGMSPERLPPLMMVEIHPKVLELISGNEAEYYDLLRAHGYSTWTLHGEPAEPGTNLVESNLVCVRSGCAMPSWPNRDHNGRSHVSAAT